MIIPMSAELIATIIGTVVTVVAIAITVYAAIFTIRKSNEDTQRILERIGCAIDKIASHSAVDLGLQGVEIAEEIESEEEAKKLGEVVKYNSKLKVAYYMPRKSGA